MLAIQLISALLFYGIAMLTVVCYPQYWPIVLGIYLFRLMVQTIIYIPIMRKLQVTGMVWLFPLLDVSYYSFICIHGFFALFKKEVKWK